MKKFNYLAEGVNVCVSFSGGKTSGYMSYLLKKHSKSNLFFVFANTGQEDERTLDFVNMCDKKFSLGVIWVEADVMEDWVGTRHKIVSYETACRDGSVFESVIKKYGIPNKAYPHCTRELKAAPIKSYMRMVVGNKYITAIGIRADEYRRCVDIPGLSVAYPLADRWIKGVDDVERFWETQDFTLDLYPYQGNCVWCWKKSFKKLYMIARENRSVFDFPLTMEEKYGKIKCDEGERVFFRGHTSTRELLDRALRRKQLTMYDITNDGCSGSCEIIPTI